MPVVDEKLGRETHLQLEVLLAEEASIRCICRKLRSASLFGRHESSASLSFPSSAQTSTLMVETYLDTTLATLSGLPATAIRTPTPPSRGVWGAGSAAISWIQHPW